MSKNQAKIFSEDQMKEREISKSKKEEESKRRREELSDNRARGEENRKRAEEALEKNKKKKNSNYGYQIMFGLLGALIIYIIAMAFMNQAPALHKVSVIDETKIEDHNSNFQWKQGPSAFFEGQTLADAKKLFASEFSNHNNLQRCHLDDSTPPEYFHYKEQWPHCVLPVQDTGKTCAASYAFALSSALAERKCISNSEDHATPLSAQELLSCDVVNNGCKGGFLNNSLDYIRSKGLVTEECYPFKPELTKCEGICNNSERIRFDSYCLLYGEDEIKKEIMKNGPVVSTMQIYVDFLNYKSGIYQKGDEIAKFSGKHAIKIVGWGVETEGEQIGTKYWIIQNNFGSTWGDEGYAKIAFGQDLFFDQFGYAMRVSKERPVETRIPETATEESADEPNVNLDLDDEKK